MFDFLSVRKWKWPELWTKPVVLVDGKLVLPCDGVRAGSTAYVVTVNERNVASALSKIDVEALFLYEFRVPDLQALSHLSRLRHLRVEWSTKLHDVGGLSAFQGLETLHLCDTPNVDDVGPVSGLKCLRGFAFEGGMWNRNTARSLEPLSNLPQLEEVWLSNLKVLEGGLRPLARCPGLRKLEVSNQFDVGDFAYLAGVRPDVGCDKFAAWTAWHDGMVMPTGRGKPLLHPIADYRQVEALEAIFDKLRNRYAEEAKRKDAGNPR